MSEAECATSLRADSAFIYIMGDHVAVEIAVLSNKAVVLGWVADCGNVRNHELAGA